MRAKTGAPLPERPITTPQSWRSARLSAEELAQRKEERKKELKKEGQEGRHLGGPVSSGEEPSSLTQGTEAEEPLLPWRAQATEPEEVSPPSWRAAQLSPEDTREREEQRSLRAGERAEKRAAKREKATRDWEQAQAQRARSKGTSAQNARREARSNPPHPDERSGQETQTAPRKEKRRRERPPVDGAWLKEAGLRYLGRFAASEAHFRRVMGRKIREAETRASEDPAEHARWVDGAVQYAYQYGGLNDEQLARSLMNSMRRQGLSTAMIRQKLRLKGLDDQQVRRAFEEREEERDPELDQLASASRAARKKRLGPWGPSGLDYPARQKQLAALARRGFSFGVAKRVLEAELVQAEEWANSLN